MEQFERDAVVEVIEQLVAELGVDAVPEEIDVTGALEILTRNTGENSESQEEGATVTVEAQAADEAAETVAAAE